MPNATAMIKVIHCVLFSILAVGHAAKWSEYTSANQDDFVR